MSIATSLANRRHLCCRPSLRELHYGANQPDAFLELQLRSHAATLESVYLENMRSPCKLPVALLDACPRLRRLQCPPLADVEPHSLAGVDDLTVIASTNLQRCLVGESKSGFDRAVTRTAAMLRQAALRLTALSLECMRLEEDNPVPVLLAAVAESGRATLRELQVHVPMCWDVWPALAAAIPRLPQLDYLSVFLAPLEDDDLADVTPDTAPNLKRIKFYIRRCVTLFELIFSYFSWWNRTFRWVPASRLD